MMTAEHGMDRYAAGPETSLPGGNNIAYRVNILANAMFRGATRHYLRKVDLRMPEVRVLSVIGGTGSISARDIAQHTAMDKAQVSRAVTSLIRRGLVRREPDGADSRRVILSLEPPGRRAYEDVLRLGTERQQRLLRNLAPEERSTIFVVLDRLLSEVERLNAEEEVEAARADGTG